MGAPNLVTHIETLEQLHAQAATEANRLQSQLSQAQERVEKLARDLASARARAMRGAPEPNARVGESKWRQAARELDSFDIGELAAKVGASKPQARKKVDEYMERGVLVADGKIGTKPTFRFVKPDDPGADFMRQQAARRRLEVVPERGSVEPVAGTGRSLIVAVPKEVRPTVQRALRDGWDLSARGDGHFVLRKGAVNITIAGTPRNPGRSAEQVARALAAAKP